MCYCATGSDFFWIRNRNKSVFCVFRALNSAESHCQARPPLINNMSSSGLCDFRGRTTAARIQTASFHPCALLPITGLIRDAWGWKGYSVQAFIKIGVRLPALWNVLKQPCHLDCGHCCYIVPGSTVSQRCCVKTRLLGTCGRFFGKANSRVPNENLSLPWANIMLCFFCPYQRGHARSAADVIIPAFSSDSKPRTPSIPPSLPPSQHG